MRCYSHLSDDEREQIGLAKALGHSIGAIAQAIGRPKSTVSRELSRNRLPSGRYSPLHAAGAYQLRRRREARIERDRALRTFVVDRLAEGWTPEQISGWLKGGNEPRLRAVGCETIYAFIYRAAQQAEQLWRYLTRHHKRRRPRRSRPSQDTIKDRVSIHERPKHVEARTEGGHWEGDLIICKRTRPVLVLHERKSRVTLAARLAGKTAAETISVMLAVFARVDPALRKSITFDNDTAFAQHALLRTMRAMTTWFCDAYASWQKGGVENANGRLRRWLPRQIDIDKVSDEEIQDIVITANTISRPENAWASRPLFRQSSKSLAKTCKSGSHSPVALGSRTQAWRVRQCVFADSRPVSTSRLRSAPAASTELARGTKTYPDVGRLTRFHGGYWRPIGQRYHPRVRRTEPSVSRL